MGTSLQLGNIILDRGSSNTSHSINVEVISDGDHDFLNLLSEFSSGGEDESLRFSESEVDLGKGCKECQYLSQYSIPSGCFAKAGLFDSFGTHPLQDTDRECSGLSGTRLSLSNDIPSGTDRHDGTFLNGRGSFETVGVDSSKELGFKFHVVEAVGGSR